MRAPPRCTSSVHQVMQTEYNRGMEDQDDVTAEPGPARSRFLFEASPLPLWIYDLASLRILDVNEVACAKYGWTREQFLAMTLRELRPAQDVAALEESVRTQPAQVFNAGFWRHRLADGRLIDVEITSHEVVFQGRRARIVCPIDVTERRQVAVHLPVSRDQLATSHRPSILVPAIARRVREASVAA